MSNLTFEKKKELLGELHSDWELVKDKEKLRRKISYDDFKKPLDALIRIGHVAEDVWHHPDLELGWGYLVVNIWTHDSHSVEKKDFEFAKRVDQLIND